MLNQICKLNDVYPALPSSHTFVVSNLGSASSGSFFGSFIRPFSGFCDHDDLSDCTEINLIVNS